MRVFRDMDALPVFLTPVVTVGSFDGVHLGHRHLLKALLSRARESGGETIVVTFSDHPRRVLGTDDGMKLLTTLEEKTDLLARAGVDNLVVMPFNENTSRLSPEEFMRDFLVGRLGAHELVVGYNHRLGQGRAGGVDVLRELGEKYGVGVHEASKFEGGGDKISSTAIREALLRGDVETAERMLGRSLGPR